MRLAVVWGLILLILGGLNAQKRLSLRDSVAALVAKSTDFIAEESRNYKAIDSVLGDWLDELPLSSGKNYSKWKARERHLKDQLQLSAWKIDKAKELLTYSRQLAYASEFELKEKIKMWHKTYNAIVMRKDLNVKEENAPRQFPGTQSDEVYDFQIYLPCSFDNTGDAKIKANAFRTLFNYTDPAIASFFKDKDFLNTYVRFLTSGKKNIYLEFKILFTSPKADAIYGTIQSGSPLKITFMNGDFIYLSSYLASVPKLEPLTGHTIYYLRYRLDNEDLKYLRNEDVDSISLIWSGGMEEYQVYELSIFKELLACLEIKS